MSAKKMMRGVRIREAGGPEVLTLTDCKMPEISAHDVLIKVHAAGVNRPDVLQRQGYYAPPADASPLPGLEVCGVVAACGSSANLFREGDRVMALTHGGGYAEYCAVNETHCLAVPDCLSDIEAAAVPETFFTVYYNVFMRAQLQPGERLLVHGGASGIGTTAIQLARAEGCTVLVTAGSKEKCDACLALGADVAIDYKTGDWQAAVAEATDGKGVDVILDMVAGNYLQKNLDSLARDGRCVIIAFLGGSTAKVDLRPLLVKRLTITGSTLRPQSVAEKADIAAALRAKVMPWLATGKVRPVIYKTFALADAGPAHALLESNAVIGKIVLEVA